MNSLETRPPELDERPVPAAHQRTWWSSLVVYSGLNRLSGVYAWIGLFVLFAIWEPSTFLTSTTANSIGSNQAVSAILAIALILPLAAGLFDLSIAANFGLTCCLALYLQVHGWGTVETIVACLAAGAIVGSVNGMIVVGLGVSSFIATLGTSSILAAASYMITNGNELVAGPKSNGFVSLGQGKFLTIPDPVWYAIVVAIIVYYVTEWTAIGRYTYATGGNPEASKLVGIRVGRIQFSTLLASGLLGGLGGVILAAQLGSATYDVGPAYLLPAFSAALLGATQIKTNGRANVLGTLVAVILLATGIYGLSLAGAPTWVPDLFDGVALIIAVALSVRANRSA